MKENQKAVIILFYISIFSFLLELAINLITILVSNISLEVSIFLKWSDGLCLAVFTSSILSLVISFINFKIMLKKNVEKLIFLIYQLYTSVYSTIYNEEKQLTLKIANEITKVYTEKVHDIYLIIFELDTLSLYKKSTKLAYNDLKNSFIEQYNFFADFDKYVYTNESDFNKNNAKMYQILMKKIEDENFYYKAKKIARLFGGNVYSLDEFINKEKLIKEMSNRFKDILDKTEKWENKLNYFSMNLYLNSTYFY